MRLGPALGVPRPAFQQVEPPVSASPSDHIRFGRHGPPLNDCHAWEPIYRYIDQRIRPKRKAVIRMRLLARVSRMYISAVGQKIAETPAVHPISQKAAEG